MADRTLSSDRALQEGLVTATSSRIFAPIEAEERGFVKTTCQGEKHRPLRHTSAPRKLASELTTFPRQSESSRLARCRCQWTDREFRAGLRFRNRQNRGFTLIEVVAGLILLATLGVGMLLAVGKHQRQIRLAQKRIIAAKMADEMASVWFSRREGLPLNSGGSVPATDGWTWQVAPVSQRIFAGVPVNVIRLQIADRTEVLCSLELVRKITITAEVTP